MCASGLLIGIADLISRYKKKKAIEIRETKKIEGLQMHLLYLLEELELILDDAFDDLFGKILMMD